MEATQSASLRLSEAVRDRIEGLWDLHETGEISLNDFRAAGVSLVAQANTAGVQLADIGLAAEVVRQLNRPASPLGLSPSRVQVDPDRISRDIARIINSVTPETVAFADVPEARRTRLGEWARTEPLLTVATATQAGMVARGAEGWIRRLDSDPCRLCIGWADGVVRAPTTRMKRHNGCGCIQQPVFGQNVSTDAEAVNARLSTEELLEVAAEQNPGQAVQDLMADLGARIDRRDPLAAPLDTSGGFLDIRP